MDIVIVLGFILLMSGFSNAIDGLGDGIISGIVILFCFIMLINGFLKFIGR